jgi:voltage-gated sodium channel
MRDNIKKLVESKKFQNFIIAVIIFNAITLGIETSRSVMNSYGHILHFLDKLAIVIFTIEILLKLICYRFRFFRSSWNVFDFIIVTISLIPAAGALSVLRTLRILRVLRLISNVSSMRRVIEGLFKAIPGISSVALIIILLFYIFAVIGTKLFGADFPDWFGDLGKTMFTLFQIMTLESWSMGIVRPVMEIYPHAWIFFSLYILVTTFTMLNLFIAVIVNAMHSEADNSQDEREEIANRILAGQEKSIATLLQRIDQLEKKIDDKGDK